MPKIKTYEEVKKIVESKGLSLISKEYINSVTKLQISCPQHGLSETSFKWLRKGTGCNKCGQEIKGKKSRTSIEIIRKSIIELGYIPLFDSYKNGKAKLKVKCEEHGVFYTSWGSLRAGRGCRACGYITVGKKTRTSIEEIQKLAEKINAKLLTTTYDSYDQKIELKCEIHGIFNKTLHKLIKGQGCKWCSYKKSGDCRLKSHEQFEKEVNAFGYKVLETYKGARKKIKLECKKHGEFIAEPNGLLGGHGCQRCALTYSGPQKEVAGFLKQLNFEFRENDRKQIAPQELDIYIPSLNLAIEYCGLYWHSELQKSMNYHKEKMEKCNQNNIRLITIFEDEWLERRSQVEGFLKSVLNKNEVRLFARKLDLKVVPKKEASQFLEDHHIQGSTTIDVAFGLYNQAELVAVMTGNKHHRQGHQHLFVLNRLAFKSNVSIAGGSSRLLKALVQYARENGYSELISWSDNRWSEGNVYEKLGFTLVEELKPDYSYVSKQTRVSKQSCQKKNLVKRGAVGITEKEMALSLGLFRIWDCGKLRWSILL